MPALPDLQLTALAGDLQDEDLRAQLAEGFERIGAMVESAVMQADSAGDLLNVPGAKQAAEMLGAIGRETSKTRDG